MLGPLASRLWKIEWIQVFRNTSWVFFLHFPPHYRGMFVEAVAMRFWKLGVGAEVLMKEIDSM